MSDHQTMTVGAAQIGRWCSIGTMLLALSAPAAAEQSENDIKEFACRRSPSALIGLSRSELRDRCGGWVKSNFSVSAGREIEQLVWYGGYLYVYLENGKVRSAQVR